jgi:hypothetical protein
MDENCVPVVKVLEGEKFILKSKEEFKNQGYYSDEDQDWHLSKKASDVWSDEFIDDKILGPIVCSLDTGKAFDLLILSYVKDEVHFKTLCYNSDDFIDPVIVEEWMGKRVNIKDEPEYFV